MVTAQDTGIVTPEAVRLEFESANIASRFLALLLDSFIQGVALAAVLLLGAAVSSGAGVVLPDYMGITLVLLLVFAVFWGYPTAFETARGRTPGKAALGLRVVTTEGAPVRFRHAAIRAAFSLIDFYLLGGGVAVVSVLLTKRQQRLGDLVAGTLVLRERTAATQVAPIRFAVPPGAEGYAQTVDPSGLEPEDYAAIRSFLLRAASLDPDARVRLGTGLAQRLAARLAHTPPPTVSPELFLVVAAARYQQRFEARGDRAPDVLPSDPFAPPSPVPAPRDGAGAPHPAGTGGWGLPTREPAGPEQASPAAPGMAEPPPEPPAPPQRGGFTPPS